ncbi:hypothetical protein [Niastella populi]|uniref:Anti-sigma factor n=1 Tax=Niastella populi TaxID=550983 RepID=A0A1V9FR58_9BACT|nr:hypothetical protein [Niastella populi]OQP60808.1 hypothetical protein A4R26_19590 [Niastella populi]
MSKGLEQFMRDNRNQFDTDEPGERVWKNLEQELTAKEKTEQKQTSQGGIISMLRILRWTAAAAILILAGIGIYSLLNNRPGNNPVAVTPPQQNSPAVNDKLLKEINPGYAKEVVQFTRLIEQRQNELKEIEKVNPNLYKMFVADINKLDSSYNALKKELPENPNREQLLEAMIENLRLQTEILNQQLSIINQIKASKSNEHDTIFSKI